MGRPTPSFRRGVVGTGRALALVMALTPPAADPGQAPAAARFVCPPCGCARDGHVFHEDGTCPSCGMALVADGGDPEAPEEVADRVWVIRHHAQPFGSGNTVVVAGDRDALVVDSGFTPGVARGDIARIRQLTGTPVRYLLNTHWHNDHNAGNATYMEAFPGLAIIAHAETRRDMDLHVASFPDRLEAGIAERLARLQALAERADRPPSEATRAELAEELRQRQLLAEQYQGFVYRAPTITFEDGLTVDLGNREVQIRHLGRGNTRGDAVLILPRERVVVAGDILVHPLPYVYDGYPTEWIATLDRISRLDVDVIVPGHGEVQRGRDHLLLVQDLLRSAVAQLDASLRRRGPAEFLTLDAVRDDIDLEPFRHRFVGDVAARNAAFDEMTERLVRLVFTEAALR